MNILVKFPTRGRPDLFFKTLDLYYNLASNKNKLFFLISLDIDDKSMCNAEVNLKLLNYDNLQFIVGNSSSKIDAVNRDMDLLEYDYDIIILASDDMIPQVVGYDDIIRDKMENLYSDTDGILFFNDGYKNDELNTLCILGKKYYQRFNYIYYPGYKSLFADNEFMDVGYLLNKQTYIEQCIIKHEHPDNGFTGMLKDQIHNLNVKYFYHDRDIYQNRKLNNFGLDI